MEKDSKVNVTVLIPAAGASTRMGGGTRKPFLCLQGEMILLRTCRRLASIEGVREVIVAVHPEDLERARGELWDDLKGAGVTLVVQGGESRAESVWNALSASDPAIEWVAVHDAARPFVSKELCRGLFALAAKRKAVIPILPVQDTIKRVEGDLVIETPRRLGLVRVQTPQVFHRELLVEAYDDAIRTGGLSDRIVDDASLVETIGEKVTVVYGDPYNIKITTPADLKLAEAMLAYRLVE